MAVVLFAVFSLTPPGRRVAAAAAAPVVSVCRSFGHGVAAALRWITPGRSGRLSAEQRLQARVIELEAEVAQCRQLEVEYRELRRSAGLPPRSGWRAIVAEVIARDPGCWNEKIVVNRGWADGAATGAAVLDGSGAVLGRLIQCDRHSSVLATVLSPECHLGARLEKAPEGGTGVLRGLGEAHYAMYGYAVLLDYLSDKLQAAEGDRIVSSGMGGWLPEGLPIAAVSGGRQAGNALHLENALRGQLHCLPLAALSSFRYAVILVPAP